MKTTLYLLAALVFIGFSLDIKITFKPFTVTCTGWLNTLGWLLLIAAIVCFNVDQYRKGIKRGSEISKEVIKNVMEEERKTKEAI